MDVNARRLKALADAAAKQGIPDGFLTVRAADLRELPAQQQQQQNLPLFDRVLLDVPCSGLGVLAKRADLRWRRQPADIAKNAQLQVLSCSSAQLGKMVDSCLPFGMKTG